MFSKTVQAFGKFFWEFQKNTDSLSLSLSLSVTIISTFSKLGAMYGSDAKSDSL